VDLEKVRAELEARRRELQHRLERVARRTRHRDEPLPQDFAEQAVELENQEVLEALDGEIADELQKIQKALARLDEGIYTICSICGEEIPAKRLKALPFTDRCVSCAEELEH